MVLLLGYAVSHSVRAQEGSNWITPTTPGLSKIIDTNGDPLEASNNNNCSEESYVPTGQAMARTACIFLSTLGRLTTSGQINIGADTYVNLTGPQTHSFFLPTPDLSRAYVAIPSAGSGEYVGVYRHLTKASLHKEHDVNLDTYYDVTEQPDVMVHDPVSGGPLELDTASMAFSANGEWLVASLPHRGLARINASDLSVHLFARPIEPSWFTGVAKPSLAISDDGRYVAGNVDLFGVGNLNVYDIATCNDQSTAPPEQEQYCDGKDILHGQSLTGQAVGGALTDSQPSLEHPSHIRFVNDDNISFNAHYGATNTTDYRSALFVATAPGATLHKLGLLGTGDSYISGQGIFDYRSGTDTPNNGCHVSELAYPFTIGQSNFNSYNSIACSGAETRNVTYKNDYKQKLTTYTGQVKDNIPESNRDKSSILANFLPGYIYQQEFVSTYLPQAILLSISGNDIGFTDIIQSCVASGSTCYDTYEDRAELMNEINNTYPMLVTTYSTLRQQSGGGRLYVVGYPQIALPGGTCGLNVHLNNVEVQFAVDLISYLDSVIQRAANTAGVQYVEVQHAFDGHRLCESGDKAVNGLTAGNDVGVPVLGKTLNVIGTESYHPTALGHQLLAKSISAQTSGLQAAMPKPTSYNKPSFDPSAPLLQLTAKTGRPFNIVAYQSSMTSDVIARGVSQQLAADGSVVQLQPGSQYQAVLHSVPVLLTTGTVDSDGNIANTVQIPAATETGFHTLHIYGTNMAGQLVDIQKVVYVIATADDYDGNEMPNTTQACSVVPPSGQDSDGDNIDDACDPIIGPSVATVNVAGTVHATATLSQESAGQAASVPALQSDPQSVSASPDNAILGSAVSGKQNQANIEQPGQLVMEQTLLRVSWPLTGAISCAAVSMLYFAGRLLRRSKH